MQHAQMRGHLSSRLLWQANLHWYTKIILPPFGSFYQLIIFARSVQVPILDINRLKLKVLWAIHPSGIINLGGFATNQGKPTRIG